MNSLCSGKVLGLVPARGGSKGIPGKNLIDAGGQPLIGWTLNAAKDAGCLDEVVLSSDDEKIMSIAEEYGCSVPFVRPDSLAGDESSMIDVVLHALDEKPGFQYVMLLQPTSPLRTSNDIDEAFQLMIERGAKSCVSVAPVRSHPYLMYKIEPEGNLCNVLENSPSVSRRQDLPEVYELNGAIYIADISWLKESRSFIGRETVGYQMPLNRSIDIDEYADFEEFLTLISEKNSNMR